MFPESKKRIYITYLFTLKLVLISLVGCQSDTQQSDLPIGVTPGQPSNNENPETPPIRPIENPNTSEDR